MWNIPSIDVMLPLVMRFKKPASVKLMIFNELLLKWTYVCFPGIVGDNVTPLEE